MKRFQVDLDEEEPDDSSYHCPFLHHMSVGRVDPSLALGFLCLDEAEFDDLAILLRDVYFLTLLEFLNVNLDFLMIFVLLLRLAVLKIAKPVTLFHSDNGRSDCFTGAI